MNETNHFAGNITSKATKHVSTVQLAIISSILASLQNISASPDLKLATHENKLNNLNNGWAIEELNLDEDLSHELKKLAIENHSSLEVLLLSIWAVLFYRYNQESEVIFGINSSCAKCVSSNSYLPFHLTLEDDLNTKDFLLKTKQYLTHIEPYINAHSLHNDPDINKILYAPGLFNTLFLIEESKSLKIDAALKKEFNLIMHVLIQDQKIKFKLFYDPTLYEKQLMQHLVLNYKTLIIHVLNNIDNTVKHIPILSDEEKLLLNSFNTANITLNETTTKQSIQKLFEEQAAQNPSSIAITYQHKSLTYKELNEQANRLAHYLKKQGVTPNTYVAIYLDRSIEMIIGLLAVLKAGGTYLPLDCRYPKERLEFMLSDTQAKIVLTQKKLLNTLDLSKKQIIDLDDQSEFLSEPNTNPSEVTVPTDLAYVIYTSGSTGIPKGVMLPHQALLNLILWQKQQQAQEKRNVLQFTTLSFDMSFFEIFTALASGGVLVLISEDDRLDLNRFSRIIQEYSVELITTSVSFLERLAEENLDINYFLTLKEIITAGEQLVITPAIRKFFNQLKWCKLKNYYGPSETHVATAYQLSGSPNDWPILPPIGRPIANTKLLILDENKQAVPIGITGEVYIRGICLAKGYWSRPELTADRFITFPDNNNANDLMYRTGDIGRYQPDGNVLFMGRKDHQVKIRGFRIELEEIEATLMQHADISKTVVIAHELENQKQLIAYYSRKTKASANYAFIEELRQMLINKLPAYMIPSLFIEMEKMPVLPNGKIDKKALPSPSENVLFSQAPNIKPSNKIEKTIASIWSQVLHFDDISTQANFFLLGGNSLIATQIVARLNKLFNTDFPISIIFENNTIEKLAARIKEKKSSIKKINFYRSFIKKNKFLLTPAQGGLWFLDRYEEGKATYNIPLAIHLSGKLNNVALKQSLQLLIDRHQALRSYFKDTKNGPVLFIDKKLSIVLNVEKVDKKTLSEVLAQEAVKKFDLSKPPLIRVKLFQIDQFDYVLMITFHHIIADGRSIDLFKEELSACYAAFANNEKPTLSPLKMNYLDLVNWQESNAYKQKAVKHLNYWTEKLHGFSPLTLPTDYSRPAKQNYIGNYHRFILTEDLLSKLRSVSIKNNATLFMTMLAVFNILLSRYSGQDDIVIGTMIDNRDLPESENVFGYFINNLVLRNNLAENFDFNTLLQQVRTNCLEAYANQSASFELLVDNLNVERSVAYHPIFQVMFVWQNSTQASEINFPEIKTATIPVNTYTAKFDLTFEFVLRGSQLECQIEYNSDLYRQTTIQRMADHLQRLLSGVVKNPFQPINFLPLLTETEYKKIQHDWNTPKQSENKYSKIHHFFSEQANKTPNNIAVVYKNKSMTYAELEKKSSALAYLIQEHCPQQSTFIGLCVERSLDLIIGILGILKAGNAYIPLDPELPDERLKFIIEDANCGLILTQEKLQTKILACSNTKNDTAVICIDKVEFKDIPPKANIPLPSSSDLAYLIYTSGTTGNPKGVKQTHHNVLRLMSVTQPMFNFNDKDVWTLFHSYAFDFSVWEMWGSLCYGGCLIIPTYEETRDPARFYGLVSEKKVTVLNQTPSAFQAFIREDLSRSIKLSSLRYVIFGGEALKTQMLAGWWNKYSDTQPKLVNMYGITETTVHTTYKLLQKQDLAISEVSNIGKPLEDMTAYIVDKHLNLLPIGVPGELLIGNAGLADGYLNRPGLTNEKFILSPFLSPELQAQKEALGEDTRLYRTGDLARWLEDGSLEYLGRIDNQVKLNGFRIELAEIEFFINKHIDIEQALVRLVDNDGIKQLIAYYVAKKSALMQKNITSDQLKSYLKMHLPSYMVPHIFIQLDSFPLTSNMKVDFKALPMPWASNPSSNINLTTQVTTKEKILIEIWQKVLRINDIKVTDNFFSVGGDSMSSIRIVYAAKEHGLHFSVTDIFKHQTPRELAKNCYLPAENEEIIVDIPAFSLLTQKDQEKLPKEIEDAYPQAALQTGMLYHSLTSPLAAVYLDVFSYNVAAPYIDQYFRDAINTIAKENTALRTSFNMLDFSEPIQIIHKHVEIPIIFEDLRKLTIDKQSQRLEDWLEQQKTIAFNLEQAPLFRIGIHVLSENKFVLGLCFHHAILDGWSVATLLTQLLKRYNRLLNNKSDDNITELKLEYKYFVQLEKSAIASLEHKKFWQNELDNYQFTRIAPWPTQNPSQSDLLEEAEIVIDKKLSKQLQTLAQEMHVSIDIILLAAHIKLLSFLANSKDITAGVVFNGRPEMKYSERTLGLFLNSLPFRLSIDDQSSWQDLIAAVAAKKAHIYPYRHYPLSKIHADLNSNTPFDFLFYFVNFHIYKELKNEKNINLSARKLYERTNFPLALVASIDSETLTLNLLLKYQSKIYTRPQIESLTSFYQKTLFTMVNDYHASHKNLNLVSKEEKNKIINLWNDTNTNYPFDKLTSHLFEEQAQHFPERIAITCGAENLTYKQLNQKVNQLANYLINSKVAKGTFVAVYMERGIEMVVAALAIFKVGAVYVPLDLNYPMERIKFILDDTQSQFVLTQSQTKDLSLLFKHKQIHIDKINDQLNALPVGNLNNQYYANDLAYVLYTSGSTGQPKGVMIEHRSLINLLFGFRDKISFSSQDVFLALTSISFDISLIELFLPLISGARCVVGDRIMAKDPAQIINAIEKYNVTIMQATPTTWRMLFDYDWKNERDITILCGGEALPQDLSQKILAYSRRAWNLYGPTETTIWSTVEAIDKSYAELDYYPIGSPLPNTTVFILNDYFQLCPVGVIGELYIGGDGLARGYLNRLELTKEKFLENPFLNTANPDIKILHKISPRLYRTGDLVQWLPNGTIRYIGRADEQLKVHGYRIEAGEIEFALLQHEKIKQCAVILHKTSKLKQLGAYIVLHANTSIENINEISEFLKQKLPSYMIPEKFFLIDHLPVNSSGKIDKKQLVNQTAHDLANNRDYAPPITHEQIQLAKIWTTVLHINNISLNDNFFDLGGNSLLTLEMINKVRGDFQITLDFRCVIEFPTLEALSKKISSIRNNMANTNNQDVINFTRQIPNPIVILQEKGNKTPLFLVHPVGGGVFYYLPLVKLLGAERPIYAIQDPGIEARDLLFHTLPEMANFYIKAVKRYQPIGPYYLAGSSFGANVAVEMARQLTDQGDHVAFIGLFDGIARYPESVVSNRNIFDNELQAQLPYLHDQLPNVDIPSLFLELHWHRQQMMARHIMPNLRDLELTLFKAIEILPLLSSVASESNLWDLYNPKLLEIHKIPGDHLTMHFAPNVDILAKELITCLNKIDKDI